MPSYVLNTLKASSNGVGVYSSPTDKSGGVLSLACAGQPLQAHPMRVHKRSGVCAATEVEPGDAETVDHFAR